MPLREYKKGGHHRSSKLFVIAVEGVREYDYFEYLGRLSTRVRVEALGPLGDETGKSSAGHVLRRAKEYVTKNGITKTDDVWLALDVDRQTGNSLRDIHDECVNKKNLHIAISNPCFEVWLTMHISDAHVLNGASPAECKTILNGLIQGGYNLKRFMPLMEAAVERGISLDSLPNYYMPDAPGTKVYLLAQSLLDEFTANEIKILKG